MSLLLSDALRSLEKKDGLSPCWIQQFPTTSNNKIDETVSFLTFNDAVQCLDRHAVILKENIFLLESNHITIAYLCSNSIDFALSILAAAELAAQARLSVDACHLAIVPALLNTRWSTFDIVASLEPAKETLLVYGPEWRERAYEVQQKLEQNKGPSQIKLLPLPSFGAEMLQKNIGIPKQRRDAGGKTNHELFCANDSFSKYSPDDAVLVFTSGTTSTAKGVRLSHRALLVQAAAKIAPPCAYSQTTRMLATTVPFYHVGGLSSLLAVWMTGGALVQPSTENNHIATGFDASAVWRSLSHVSCPSNTLVVVPAMVHAMQQTSSSDASITTSFPHVDLILVGGQSLTTAQAEFLRRSFPLARIVQTFACTEAASSLTFLNVTKKIPLLTQSNSETTPPVGSCVGRPPSHVELQLFRSDDNGMVRKKEMIQVPYQVGLIATRGPHVMNGYWGQAESHCPTRDWYITSDFGYWDRIGQLYFCGRQTDTIRTGGETVWAAEVERILERHSSIAEAAVVGIADERFGETVACALVIKRPSEGLDLMQVRKWCTLQGLASYKQPRRVVVLSSLPRNSSGKVIKARLKDCFERRPTSKL